MPRATECSRALRRNAAMLEERWSPFCAAELLAADAEAATALTTDETTTGLYSWVHRPVPAGEPTPTAAAAANG
jgi:hypothetical protein